MYRTFFKRILDILFALCLLPFVLIILFLVTPLIFLSDRGPIFYNAPRMGRNGKRFTMYKLRSMQVNAPDLRNADGSTFNSENDPRVTRIGRLMRKTSMDELPQLLNVLKGDMSIIGPRPTLYSEDYYNFDSIRKKRLTVRPGITGYTQAYFRNSISQEEKFRLDAYYVENMSALFDLKIFVKTVISVVMRENVFTVTETKTNK